MCSEAVRCVLCGHCCCLGCGARRCAYCGDGYCAADADFDTCARCGEASGCPRCCEMELCDVCDRMLCQACSAFKPDPDPGPNPRPNPGPDPDPNPGPHPSLPCQACSAFEECEQCCWLVCDACAGACGCDRIRGVVDQSKVPVTRRHPNQLPRCNQRGH